MCPPPCVSSGLGSGLGGCCCPRHPSWMCESTPRRAWTRWGKQHKDCLFLKTRCEELREKNLERGEEHRPVCGDCVPGHGRGSKQKELPKPKSRFFLFVWLVFVTIQLFYLVLFMKDRFKSFNFGKVNKCVCFSVVSVQF